MVRSKPGGSEEAMVSVERRDAPSLVDASRGQKRRVPHFDGIEKSE